MNVGLIAQDSKKKLMQNFCIAYYGVLGRHKLFATGSTGRLIEEVTGLSIHKYLGGELGGAEQFANQISENDLDVVTSIYDYIISSITYDYDKASDPPTGYTTNVDEILKSGTGICLDYAAVMTTMLRSQGIPTRLEVGNAGTVYHAWISTYISDIGWVSGIIYFATLLVITALFFGAQYSAVGETSLLVLCGSILAALTGKANGRVGKGRRLKYGHR